MKYIFIDIDGTLYSNQIKGVLPSSLAAIKQARNNGNKVFLCTGRSLAESKPYLNYPVDGYVFSAGSIAYADQRRIFDQPIPKEKVNYLVDLLQKYNLGFSLAGNYGAYTNDKGLYHAERYLSGGKVDLNYPYAKENGLVTLWNKADQEEIYKIALFGDNSAEMELIFALIPEDFSKEFVFTDEKNDIYIVEIVLKTMNKTVGIQAILDHYQADFSSVVAIGDSLNDYEMVKQAKIGIAMGNGVKQLKEVADFVTDDILADGLAKAFKKFNLI